MANYRQDNTTLRVQWQSPFHWSRAVSINGWRTCRNTSVEEVTKCLVDLERTSSSPIEPMAEASSS